MQSSAVDFLSAYLFCGRMGFFTLTDSCACFNPFQLGQSGARANPRVTATLV
jgi:hypothetical protein